MNYIQFDTTPISILPQKLEILAKKANNYIGEKKYCVRSPNLIVSLRSNIAHMFQYYTLI